MDQNGSNFAGKEGQEGDLQSMSAGGGLYPSDMQSLCIKVCFQNWDSKIKIFYHIRLAALQKDETNLQNHQKPTKHRPLSY